MGLPLNKTKIICTIGPASESPLIMEKMIEAGMNVARLNFSHGSFDSHRKVIANLRKTARKTGKPLAIMADLPGPKIRIGDLADEPVNLISGAPFILTTEPVTGDSQQAEVTFERLPQVVSPGDSLFINDGIIQLEVLQIKGPAVHCRVIVGGELRSRKGLNLPGITLNISAFTARDHECLKFAVEEGVDAVSQSFVETSADIESVRSAAASFGRIPFIIAKIERAGALDHIDEIISAADGIMVARGDLGVEVPIERIAVIQKDIIRRANQAAKPVITATQMLESMIESRRPTRAEATDVANAVLDGTDAVMLSAESAMGRYPVEAVSMLARIATAAEPHRHPLTIKEMLSGQDFERQFDPAHLIALSVEACLKYTLPAAVFVPTHSGATARSISRFRLPVWIAAVSSLESTCQGLLFSYGVYPVNEPDHPEDWKGYIREWLAEYGMEGTLVLLTEGPSSKHPKDNHRMEIIDLR
ncbi:MAG: pyruvate kinase [Thermodesulfobacteriota bacterium]